MIYYIATEFQHIYFLDIKDAKSYAIENGYNKFRDTFGGEYFI
jgi:hypothetical protein